jgi:hypothetical protein
MNITSSYVKNMTSNLITVVTAATGDRQLLQQIKYNGVDYIAFVDVYPSNLDNYYIGNWKIQKVCTKFKSPIMNAKIHKILTHKYVSTPYIMWIDSTMRLKQDPRVLIDLMGLCDVAFFKHSGRRCLYKEVDLCIKIKKGDPHELMEQASVYKHDLKFPRNAGLCECGAFIRKNSRETNTLFEQWWAEICRYSDRDQVSFPVIFRDKFYKTIPGKLRYYKEEDANDYVEYHGK